MLNQKLINSGVESIYVVSIFLSAFLLFMVQPMVTKAMFPYLGGSTALWKLSVTVYQALLFFGYVYAYAMSKFCTIKKQAIIHVVFYAIITSLC